MVSAVTALIVGVSGFMWLILATEVMNDAETRGHSGLFWGGVTLITGVFGAVWYVVRRNEHPAVRRAARDALSDEGGDD